MAPEYPAVVITRNTSEEGILRAMEAGARAFIRKLFTVQDLSEKIEPLLAEKLEPAKTLGCPRGFRGVSKQVRHRILFWKSPIDVSPPRV